MSAERIRSGGLGGFFARERVEIEVEIDDLAWPPPAPEDAAVPPDDEPTPPGAAASLLDLVDMVSDADRFEPTAFVPADRVDATTGPADRPATGRGRHVTKGTVPPPPPPRRPMVSTESVSFAEVLERIATEADPYVDEPRPIEAGSRRARPATAAATAGAGTALVTNSPGWPRARPRSSGLPGGTDLLGRTGTRTSTASAISGGIELLDRDGSGGIDLFGRPTLAVPATDGVGEGDPHGPPIAGLMPARRRPSPERAITPTVKATALELAPLRPARRPVGAHFRQTSEPALAASEDHPLGRLGLPEELLPVPGGRDLRARLVHQLAELPCPPPLPATRGTVVAIVGSRGPAHDVALAVCATVGSNPDSIATIAPRTRTPKATELGTAEEAAEQRRAWRRRQTPTVAVIEAPLGQSSAWAGEVLEALEPTVVWGLVDAGRKVEDITAWSDDLGGLDALCLSGLDDTVSPASALQTGVPVVLLEGQAATPERWADVLMARVAS